MRFCLPFLHRGKQGEGLHAAPRSEMPGQQDGVDGTSPGKYSAFQAAGQREQHPDLLPGMCQSSLLDALTHPAPAIQTPSPPSRAGSARWRGLCPDWLLASTATSRALCCDSSQHEPSCPPFLTSPLLSCQHGAAGAAAGLKSETAKGWGFLEQAVGTVSPAAQGRQMAAKAGDGCPSILLLPSSGPFTLGQPQHTAGELR